jgi:hypothetical protein
MQAANAKDGLRYGPYADRVSASYSPRMAAFPDCIPAGTIDAFLAPLRLVALPRRRTAAANLKGKPVVDIWGHLASANAVR